MPSSNCSTSAINVRAGESNGENRLSLLQIDTGAHRSVNVAPRMPAESSPSALPPPPHPQHGERPTSSLLDVAEGGINRSCHERKRASRCPPRRQAWPPPLSAPRAQGTAYIILCADDAGRTTVPRVDGTRPRILHRREMPKEGGTLRSYRPQGPHVLAPYDGGKAAIFHSAPMTRNKKKERGGGLTSRRTSTQRAANCALPPRRRPKPPSSSAARGQRGQPSGKQSVARHARGGSVIPAGTGPDHGGPAGRQPSQQGDGSMVYDADGDCASTSKRRRRAEVKPAPRRMRRGISRSLDAADDRAR